jgi:hypothetical protein
MGRAGAIAAGIAAATAALTLAGDAAAWCRTTTSKSFTPTIAKPCDDAGLPLYWSSRCVGYDVQESASVQVDLATARATMAKGFAAWASADCPLDAVACAAGDHGQGRPSIEAHDLGSVSCACAEYNQKSGNSNTIIFLDRGWVNCDGSAKTDADVTLALTTVTFSTDSGEIYDADMEINSSPTNAKITTADPPAPVVYDLQSIVTHEAGHFLGLAHTQPSHPEATMYARYEQGQTAMRVPSQDDVCGICAAYPPGRVTVCDDQPRHGFSGICGGGDVPSPSGCHCEAPGATSGSRGLGVGAAFGLAALVTGVLARRRR